MGVEEQPYTTTRVSQWVSNNVQGRCGMVSYAKIQNTMEVASLFLFPNLTQSTVVISAQNHTEMGSAKCSSHFTKVPMYKPPLLVLCTFSVEKFFQCLA